MILDEIVRRKRERLQESKIKFPLNDIKEKIRDLAPDREFKKAIKREKGNAIKLIAEIKKASPSRGIIRGDFDPVEIASIYEGKGASSVSVLTEEDFFMGKLSDLSAVRKSVKLPILRKDFIFDDYQVYESRLNGADAILLIASILERLQIEDLMGLAGELGMDSLVEIHNMKELDRALMAEAEIIGINNRNLETLKVDIDTTFKIIRDIPLKKIVVSESGIKGRKDIERIEEERIDAILVGTAFMEADDIGKKVEELLTTVDSK